MLYPFFVYITTNKTKTTLYIGMTNNIQRRLGEHLLASKTGNKTFAGRYKCIFLIYYEGFMTAKAAIEREKELKRWSRAKKETLIDRFNPDWSFLNNVIF